MPNDAPFAPISYAMPLMVAWFSATFVDQLLPVSTSAHHIAAEPGATFIAQAASLQPMAQAACSAESVCPVALLD